MTFHDVRRDYGASGLEVSSLPDHPLVLFRDWLQQALGCGLTEPNAMTLATVGEDGRPSARVVLLKEVDEEGLVFYTNYESRKARELAANPYAALVLWWPPLERQVRIEGRVGKVSRAKSEAYFRTRPLGSRLGAWISAQSRVIEGRQVLDQKLEEMLARPESEYIEIPPFWGGYRLVPDVIELWQGRPNRLHDRIRYRLEAEGKWLRERLAP